mmetsp:Transcript_3749/g.10602  ORF Transcript_3749/g.10602 Transcript_3749/m.10602 type:complete len:109 (-) Transcript_3749:1095-1421(-)
MRERAVRCARDCGAMRARAMPAAPGACGCTTQARMQGRVGRGVTRAARWRSCCLAAVLCLPSATFAATTECRLSVEKEGLWLVMRRACVGSRGTIAGVDCKWWWTGSK